VRLRWRPSNESRAFTQTVDAARRISRLGPGACEVEAIPVAVDPDTHVPAIPFGALAVDANTLNVDTSSGIATRAFTPAAACI
jgi:hypothetical protein